MTENLADRSLFRRFFRQFVPVRFEFFPKRRQFWTSRWVLVALSTGLPGLRSIFRRGGGGSRTNRQDYENSCNCRAANETGNEFFEHLRFLR